MVLVGIGRHADGLTTLILYISGYLFFCRNFAPTDENSLSFPSIFSLKLFPEAGKDWEPQLHTSRKTVTFKLGLFSECRVTVGTAGSHYRLLDTKYVKMASIG